MRPICVKCKCFYRPHKNGYIVIEGKPDKADSVTVNIRGNRHPEMWSPYKVWMTDLYKCPDCGHEIVVGAGFQPVSQDYQDDFEYWTAKSQLQVNDC